MKSNPIESLSDFQLHDDGCVTIGKRTYALGEAVDGVRLGTYVFARSSRSPSIAVKDTGGQTISQFTFNRLLGTWNPGASDEGRPRNNYPPEALRPSWRSRSVRRPAEKQRIQWKRHKLLNPKVSDVIFQPDGDVLIGDQGFDAAVPIPGVKCIAGTVTKAAGVTALVRIEKPDNEGTYFFQYANQTPQTRNLLYPGGPTSQDWCGWYQLSVSKVPIAGHRPWRPETRVFDRPPVTGWSYERLRSGSFGDLTLDPEGTVFVGPVAYRENAAIINARCHAGTVNKPSGYGQTLTVDGHDGHCYEFQYSGSPGEPDRDGAGRNIPGTDWIGWWQLRPLHGEYRGRWQELVAKYGRLGAVVNLLLSPFGAR